MLWVVCACVCACMRSVSVWVGLKRARESSARAGYTKFYHSACHTNINRHKYMHADRTTEKCVQILFGCAKRVVPPHNKSTNTDVRQQTRIAYIKHLHTCSSWLLLYACVCVCALANDDLYVQSTTEFLWPFSFYFFAFWLLLLLLLLSFAPFFAAKFSSIFFLCSSTYCLLLFWPIYILFSGVKKKKKKTTQNAQITHNHSVVVVADDGDDNDVDDNMLLQCKLFIIVCTLFLVKTFTQTHQHSFNVSAVFVFFRLILNWN